MPEYPLVRDLQGTLMSVDSVSRIHAHPYLRLDHYHYHTSPHHHGGGRDNINISSLSPKELYQSLQNIEEDFGAERVMARVREEDFGAEPTP